MVSGLAHATHIEEIDDDDDDVVDNDGDVDKILQNDNNAMMINIIVTVMN